MRKTLFALLATGALKRITRRRRLQIVQVVQRLFLQEDKKAAARSSERSEVQQTKSKKMFKAKCFYFKANSKAPNFFGIQQVIR